MSKKDDGGAPALKIRYRHRRGYSREAGGYTGWYEWQVVRGRRIVGRYDLESQAIKARDAMLSARSAPHD